MAILTIEYNYGCSVCKSTVQKIHRSFTCGACGYQCEQKTLVPTAAAIEAERKRRAALLNYDSLDNDNDTATTNHDHATNTTN